MQTTRRNLLKALAWLPALPLLGSVLTKIAHAAGIPANYHLATTDDQTPKILQYTPDAAKTNPPARADKKAFCRTCSQYGKATKEFTHPTDGKVGSCEVLLNGTDKMFVKNGGWCISYQKKT